MLSGLGVGDRCSSSARYSGAVPCRHLYTREQLVWTRSAPRPSASERGAERSDVVEPWRREHQPGGQLSWLKWHWVTLSFRLNRSFKL